MPISGGGYLRILPWWLTKKLLIEFLQKSSIYIFYIHPFELSKKSAPSMPVNTSQLTKFRFIYGRTSMLMKLNKLVTILKESGFEFTTFSRLRKNILDGRQ